MGNNLTGYIGWRGDLSFDERPFTILDGMVLCALSYLDLTCIGSPAGLTLKEAVDRIHDNASFSFKSVESSEISEKFVIAAAASRRFGELIISDYKDITDSDLNVQFAAVTFQHGDNRYIAYRGTDDSVVGWKEDFMISFTRTESQDLALDYLKSEMASPGDIYIGGHSKGANLALFAATFLPEEYKDRLKCIDLLDGPGLCKEVLGDHKLSAPVNRIHRIVPVYSVIGKLFEPDDIPCEIVESDNKGIMQHSLLSWQVASGKPVYADKNDPGSRFINEACDRWVEGEDIETRKEFVNSLFGAIEMYGCNTFTELSESGPEGFENIILTFLVSSQRALITGIKLPLAMFFGETWNDIKNRNRESFFDAALLKKNLLLPLGQAVIGLLFILFPNNSIQWVISAGIFMVAFFEGYLTIKDAREKKLSVFELPRMKFTVVAVGLAIVLVIKPQALFVWGSLFFGIAAVLLSYYAFIRARKAIVAGNKWYIAELIRAVIYFILGGGLLIVSEKPAEAFILSLGIVLLVDGLVEMIRIIFTKQIDAIIKILNRIPFLVLYTHNRQFSIAVNLIATVGINIIFALMYIIPGVDNGSGWMIFVGEFNLVCALARLVLFGVMQYRKRKDPDKYISKPSKATTVTGRLVIVLAFLFGGIVVFFELKGGSFAYNGNFMLAIAVITFTRWIYMMSFGIKSRSDWTFPVQESYSIGSCATLLSIFAMQTAMITNYKPISFSGETRLNYVTGTVAFIAMIILGIRLLVKGRRKKTA